MKKIIFVLCILLSAVLLLGVSAEETIFYENDFSDPSTLSDFKQYRMTWEIRDGGLYLTEEREDIVEKITDAFSHIILQLDEPLTDYVVEVDYMNVQTSGGVIFNADQDEVTKSPNGFRGYIAFVGNKADQAAIGCASKDDKWKGNIATSKTGRIEVGSNVHFKVTVKNKTVHVVITNMDTNGLVHEETYKIGSNTSVDPIYEIGTVGLRMRGGYAPHEVISAGTAYFDNLKVYSVPKEEVKPVEVLVHEPADPIDTSYLKEVYRNGFDSEDALSDFTAYRGDWVVFDGKLYLSAMKNVSYGQSFLLYTKDKALTELSDYVIDVDVYNIQTQGGLAGRVDLPNFTGVSDDSILGYVGYTSFSGTIPVLGYGKANGTWGGNFSTGGELMNNGDNIHLQLAFKGDVVQLTVTDLETGELIWRYAERVELWEKGTFGFRAYGKIRDGLDNINTVSYDNLVVSTFRDPSAKTEVKLTIGQTVGYIDGDAKALDAAPIIRESRTMLPVRFVAEAFGATVGWDGTTSTATVKTADVEIKITIGAKVAIVNGETVTLDAPAFIENSRTYMPVLFVAEKLGATVDWNSATSTATLIK